MTKKNKPFVLRYPGAIGTTERRYVRKSDALRALKQTCSELTEQGVPFTYISLTEERVLFSGTAKEGNETCRK